MTLTKIQLRRAARAARKLAYEFAEERGPKLEAWNWCNCLAGKVVERADLPETFPQAKGQLWKLSTAEWLDMSDSLSMHGTLSRATSFQSYGRDPGAAVFPLLALADALEALASNASAPKAPTKNLPEEA